MKFTELESLMSSSGVNTLAEIARFLHTTPQAVSNWKARDQVPYHIITKISQNSRLINSNESSTTNPQSSYIGYSHQSFDEATISLSDILLKMAEQLKVILLVPFITVFLTFTNING